MRTSRTPGRRLAAILAVALGTLGLVAATQAGHRFHPSLPPSPAPTNGPTLGPANAIATTWFCPEGTAIANGRADETVVVGNLGPRAVTATVTVLSGTSAAPVSRQDSVPAFGQRRVTVSALRTTPEPGVIVQVPGGDGIVEHELTLGSQTTIGACARQAATDWYFAGGDTGVGAEDWLTLFNPFGDDAIVDITFLTSSGVVAPGSTQAVEVARRTRVSLPLHVLVPDHDALALHAHARLGRIVAEQSISTNGTNGPAGLTTMLGVPAPASTWRVPALDAQAGTASSLTVANFAGAGTRATVSYTLDHQATLPSGRLLVPSLGLTASPIAQNVPPTGGYAVTVRGPRAGPILAALTETWSAPAAVTGIAATPGTTTTARRWAFATGRLATSGPAQLVALNPTDRRVRVTLRTATAGAPSLHDVTSVTIARRQRAVVDLDPSIGPDQVLELTATAPIVAGRLVLGPSVVTGPGIPDLR